MKNEITLQTRREFLRRTVLGSALTWTVPAFLADTFSVLQAEAADSATQTVTGKDSTILVVLQMAVAATTASIRWFPTPTISIIRRGPKIGLKAGDVLRLTDDIGFHGALRKVLKNSTMAENFR